MSAPHIHRFHPPCKHTEPNTMQLPEPTRRRRQQWQGLSSQQARATAQTLPCTLFNHLVHGHFGLLEPTGCPSADHYARPVPSGFHQTQPTPPLHPVGW